MWLSNVAMRAGGPTTLRSSWKARSFSSCNQIPLNGVQSLVLPECEQSGHQRVSLFASFSLQDFMDFPKVIFPEVHRRATMKLQDERESRIATWCVTQMPSSSWPWRSNQTLQLRPLTTQLPVGPSQLIAEARGRWTRTPTL